MFPTSFCLNVLLIKSGSTQLGSLRRITTSSSAVGGNAFPPKCAYEPVTSQRCTLQVAWGHGVEIDLSITSSSSHVDRSFLVHFLMCWGKERGRRWGSGELKEPRGDFTPRRQPAATFGLRPALKKENHVPRQAGTTPATVIARDGKTSHRSQRWSWVSRQEKPVRSST